jgi:hypothetical protein
VLELVYFCYALMVLLRRRLFDSDPSEVLVLAYGAVAFVWLRGCRFDCYCRDGV